MKANKFLSFAIAGIMSLSLVPSIHADSTVQTVKEWTFDSGVQGFSNINSNGTYSWDGSMDYDSNGGGSVKYEYKANGMKKNDGRLGYINIHQWSFTESGKVYKISAQIYGESVTEGATVKVMPNNTNKDAGVCDEAEIKQGEWTEVDGYFVGKSSDWYAFQFNGGSFATSKDAAEGFDVYYLDSVKIEEVEADSEVLSKFSPNFEFSKELTRKTAKLDLTQTKTVLKQNEQTEVKAYLLGGETGDILADIAPQSVAGTDLTAESDNEDVAVFNEKTGNIEAKLPGEAVITFTYDGITQPVAVIVYPESNKDYKYLENPDNVGIPVKDPIYPDNDAWVMYQAPNGRVSTSIQSGKPSVISFRFFVPGTEVSSASTFIGIYGGGYSLQMEGDKGQQRFVFPNVTTNPSEMVAGWNRVDFVTGYPEKKSIDDGYMKMYWYLNGKLMSNTESKINSGSIAFLNFNKLMISDFVIADLSVENTVTGTTPDLVSGNQSIAADSTFEVEFSYPIIEESIAENVVLTDKDNKQDIPFEYKAEGNKIIITPKNSLLKNTNYTLTVKKALKSTLTSAMLTSDLKYNFKTENNPVVIKNALKANNSVMFSAENNTEGNVCVVASAFGGQASIKPVYTSIDTGSSSNVTLSFDGIEDLKDYAIELYAVDDIDAKEIKLLSDITALSGADTSRTYVAGSADEMLETEYNPSANEVSVKYKSGSGIKNSPVIVRVYRKDSGSDFDKLVRFEAVPTADGGVINYTFKAGENMSVGRYCVSLYSPIDSAASDSEFNFVTVADIENAVEKINNSDNTINPNNANSIDSVFESVRDILDLVDTDFDNLANKNFVYNNLISQKPYDKDAAKLKKIYRQALKMSVLLEGDTDTLTQEIKDNHSNEYWGIKENSTYKAFCEALTDTQKKAVAAKLLTAKSFGDINDMFIMAVIVEDIKSQTSNSTVYSALSKYNDLTNIDYSVYNTLKESYRLQACKDFRSEISTKGVDSLTALKQLFEKYCDEQKTKQTKDDNNNGGGRGTGSGGKTGGTDNSGSIVIAPGKNVTSNPVPEWYDDGSKNAAQETVFDDLNGVEWAKEYIKKLYNKGVISGKDEKIFAPNDNLTREELCKMIALAFELEKNDENGAIPFGDVSANEWYYDYITICYQNGIIKGMSDDIFGVGKTVTREEISTILVRAAEAVGKSLDYDITIYPFNDESEISDWALESVSILRECLIVNGVGNDYFAPKNNVTRAQASKMIIGMLEYKY